MKFLIAIVLLAAAGCATYETVVTPENRRTLTVDRDYQAVYRIITTQLGTCLNNPAAVRSAIFHDTKTARVFISSSGGATVGSVHEIKADGPTKTVVDYYPDICLTCTEDQARSRTDRLRQWIAEGSTAC